MPNGRSSRPCCRRRGLTKGQLSRYDCPRQVDLSFIPVQRRADRGIETCCAATILCNPSVSPWPGLARPPTSSLRTLRLRQDVDARDEPGQGVFGGKIWSKTLARMAPQLSPDSPASGGRGREGGREGGRVREVGAGNRSG